MKLYVCERAYKHKTCKYCHHAEPHNCAEPPGGVHCYAASKKLKCILYSADDTNQIIQELCELRRRVHNIATGAEQTKDDNSALILIARACEDSYHKAPDPTSRPLCNTSHATTSAASATTATTNNNASAT